MTAKEYLQQVKHKDAEIKNLCRDKESVKEMFYSLGGMPDGERVQSSRNNDKFGTLYSRIDEMERNIDDKIEASMLFKLKVSQEINTLKNPKYIAILNMRYIHYKSWEEIAESGFDVQYNVRHILRVHGYALMEFETLYKTMLAEL